MDESRPAPAGHNRQAFTDQAALREYLTENYPELMVRQDELLAAFQRAPQTVEDDDTARRFADFIKSFNAFKKHAEAYRQDEKEIYLAGGRTVDGWFKTLTEPVDKAVKALKERQTDYLRKKEAEERRRREEAERKAREEAEAARKAAEEAAAKLETDEDLDGALAAEEAAAEKQQAYTKAEKEADAKAAELSRVRGDYGAVSSLRTRWTFRDLDRAALDLEVLRPHLPQDALEKALRSYIKAGGREIAGATIYEERTL